MTLTVALIVNGVLVACLFVALFLVVRIPFRIERPRRLTTEYVADRVECELSRAA